MSLRDRHFQSSAATAQKPQTDLNLSHGGSKPVFVDTAEAARMFGKPTRAAFRMWAKRRGITVIKDGRRWLVDRLEVEARLRLKATVA